MLMRLFNAILPPTVLIAAGVIVSTAWSKPPDLPVSVKETCCPQCPQESLTIFASNQESQALADRNYKEYAAGRFYEIGQQCEAKGDLAMARNCYEEATRMAPESEYGKLASKKLSVFTIAGLNSWITEAGVETQEEPPTIKQEVVREEQIEPRRIQQAHSMLQMGMRYQRAGDLDNAYRCYQDSHAICPVCRDGETALDRMVQIEAMKSRQMQPREGGIEEQEPPVDRRRPPFTPDELEQRDQAESLFDLGERTRRAGNLRKAYGLYQETHLTFPECYFGMKAIERMHEIETRR
jgi:tetratricopeptide (TPR) repeat protein